MRSNRLIIATLFAVTFAVGTSGLPAQDQAPTDKKDDQAALFKKFSETMTNARLVGQFTIVGREDGQLSKEEYTVESATKLPSGDMWLIKARIRYNGKDVTVPIPLEVKWAGDTPVITLTNLTIPGLGTFGSRVVIYDNKYAGTWRHGDVAGHLFGTIERNGDQKKGDDAKK
jgi:hypothetical protein